MNLCLIAKIKTNNTGMESQKHRLLFGSTDAERLCFRRQRALCSQESPPFTRPPRAAVSCAAARRAVLLGRWPLSYALYYLTWGYGWFCKHFKIVYFEFYYVDIFVMWERCSFIENTWPCFCGADSYQILCCFLALGFQTISKILNVKQINIYIC